MKQIAFHPHPLLRNSHLMTIAPALTLRRDDRLERSARELLVDVGTDSKVLIHLHLQEKAPASPVLLMVHGLEGSSSAPYLLNLTRKALALGFSAARMNLRNCGRTMHLTPTLYNAGMSDDVITVVDHISALTGSANIFLAGYSLGGNIVLKAAAELGASAARRLSGVCAVSPALDLNACVSAIEHGFNRLYEMRFLYGLKNKVKEKARLYPHRFDASKLAMVQGLRSFDELFTAPDAGYSGADEYYRKASSLSVLDRIELPTLIIAAQDDPIVPFASFASGPVQSSKWITLLAPEHGGHGGFINSDVEKNGQLQCNDRLWAENRVVEFCLENLVRQAVT